MDDDDDDDKKINKIYAYELMCLCINWRNPEGSIGLLKSKDKST